MSNTSATGGYLVQTEAPLPDNRTLSQFIQQVIVGMTGINGTKVREKFQKNMPEQEAAPEDIWCAFFVTETNADANSYHVTDADGEGSKMQRHLELVVDCSFYGEGSKAFAEKLRDGFQISQNREVLRSGNMGFKEVSTIRSVPEKHGQVWFKRYDMSVVLRRQINKTFAVLSFNSAGGTIKAEKDNQETENVPWNVES